MLHKQMLCVYTKIVTFASTFNGRKLKSANQMLVNRALVIFLIKV